MAEKNTAAGSAPDDALFSFDTRVRYSEVDHRGLLTPAALINYLQDCAIFHSERVGLGLNRLKAQGRAWVLSHWQVIVDRYPAFCEPITVGTFASAFRGLSAQRFFTIRDSQGTCIARAKSTWAFIDLATGRPTRLTPAYTDPYGTREPLDMPAEARRVALADRMEPREPITVRRSQIDTNEHVNNAQYVQMALELLPREVEPAQIRVDYRRPAVLGTVVRPWLGRDENRVVVNLADEAGAPYAIVELS